MKINPRCLFCRNRAGFFFAIPEAKSVGEDYVTKQIVLRAIVDIERGVELEIARDVAGETDRR
jgi:hypothetical protein